MPMSSAQSSPGEEVVISGLAGCFPESQNVYQLRDNLFNKVDMVTEDDQRWKFEHHQLPKWAGKLPNITKFDASFFGINYKQAHVLDPLSRLMMERTYEAIVDAGVNPQHLKGQKVGVFVGACFSETEKFWYFEKPHENGHGLTGCIRAMYANQISHWLGITGPSYAVDSACSSSSYAFEQAYRAILNGSCDSAIVASAQLCLHPYLSLFFFQIGVLSHQGRCKVFDNDADGYARSEAACVMFLQKTRDAKRIYATVVHAKNNSDGFTDEGILHPSRHAQKLLLEQCYQECGIDPSAVKYIEAHGTGTRVCIFKFYFPAHSQKLSADKINIFLALVRVSDGYNFVLA
ncbi:fatty acid synthase-like [Zootermopsis nevadensis]|uniref:fatty acid synthase-like n=1 Tax=Zootermopsis nevadensis TaxID=136037 RepID=UPI000B8EB7F4|nr:fatty acid synthase-like [Zootermopsis nevadensis]